MNNNVLDPVLVYIIVTLQKLGKTPDQVVVTSLAFSIIRHDSHMNTKL